MGGYSNIVLIISCYIFFFSKNIVCRSSMSTFVAKTSNSIIKSVIFCFLCLKDSIFYLVSAIFVLSLNVILISLTNSSQSWVPNSLSSSSSFLYVYMSTILSLRHARITVILLLVSRTLLLLRTNHISLH